jgi:hypothetical protein
MPPVMMVSKAMHSPFRLWGSPGEDARPPLFAGSSGEAESILC